MKYYISGVSRFGEPRVLDAAGFTRADTMEEATFVVFTGGADISPAIYGEAVHPSSYPNPNRDRVEIDDFNKAQELGLATLGICRGAQLLNCLVGGSLFQDIAHPGFHIIETDTGETFMSNSVHHQMMRVGEGAIIKAWAHNLSHYHKHMENGVEVNVPVVEQEPEIVIYPEYRMVLVQGHPEFNSEDDELARFREFVFNLVKEYV